MSVHPPDRSAPRVVKVDADFGPSPEDSSTALTEPVTLKRLNAMAKRGEPFACLACYDATTARAMQEAGVHLLLAGDSAAQVILGMPSTVHMPLDFSIQITAALKRGAPNAFVMGDMPFLSYHTDERLAVENAGRYLTEGMADAVKLEVDHRSAGLVEKMSIAGIPVCAHIGLKPQQVGLTGGYVAAGRTADLAADLLRDAKALEEAGAVMLLIEATPPEVARRIVEASGVPVIGIGAGSDVHGQILVIHDLVGLTEQPPRFAEPTAALGPELVRAGRSWVRRVAGRDIGGQAYQMRPGESDRLDQLG